MPSSEIKITNEADQRVFEELKRYNDQFEPQVNYQPVSICIENEGEFLGGLEGNIAWDRFEISNMVVLQRQQGIGTALMSKLEDYCHEKGIKKIYAWTLDFQAPGFYTKMGFETACIIKDFAGSHSCYHFIKRLV